MRTQNLISALVFSLLFYAYASMHLLNLFPSSALLWQANITFAREARPVFELFDAVTSYDSIATLASIVGFFGLCWLAAAKKHKMMTAVTTHTALFCVAYASIASYGAAMGPQISSASGMTDIVRLTSSLQPVEQAMAALVAILTVTCLSNHLDIVKDLVMAAWQKSRMARQH